MRITYSILLIVACGGILWAAEKAPVLYHSDFEGLTAGALPGGWTALGGSWVAVSDETGVLQQAQAAFRGLAQAGRVWADYDVACTLRPLGGSGPWGTGVVGYWQAPGDCYRLSSYGGVLALWRLQAGQAEALAATRLELKPQVAYRFRLSLRNDRSQTWLRGKVWAAAEPEPAKWLLTAPDLVRPLRQGQPGLFTGRGAAAFTDLTITDANDQPLAQDPLLGDGAGRHWNWQWRGGEWQSPAAGQPLSQTQPSPQPGLGGAAYAVLAGWKDYTVQVMARAAAGSRGQGLGVAGYWQDDQTAYILGHSAGSSLFLARRSGSEGQVALTTAPFAITRGVWYQLKMRLETHPDSVRLLGKIWPARAGEPVQWQLQAEDRRPDRITGGEVGVWCLDDVAAFDDLQVKGNE